LNIKEQEAIKKIIQETISSSIQSYLNSANKKIYDKRLRNTRLLLDNYNNFIEHCGNAVYNSEQLEEDIFVDNEIIINSILKSKRRTEIMINHIKSCLDYYINSGRMSKNIEIQRRVEAVELIYIKKMKHNEAADYLHVDPRTFRRDRKKAVEELAVIFWGVDGIKLC